MIRNFYSASHAPYYIYALDYVQQSAGIRALHYFCHALNESGLEAYVSCKVTTPHLRTPILTNAVIKRHQIAGREPIVVYPEVVPGNPLSGNTVVRWLLNRPGHLAGDKYFSDSDPLFFYDPNFLPEGMQGEILHIPTCDLSIFNNTDNPHDDTRDLVCFYANKFLAKGGKLTRHAMNATSLCQDQKLTHIELASLLRRAKVLYVYEPTALITEALLCGCPVVIVQTDYWRENTNGDSHMPHCGLIIEDSPGAIAEAKANTPDFRRFYEESLLRSAWVQLDRFIELTQNAAKSRSASRPGQECEGQEELYRADMENDSRYSSWRAARQESGSTALPEELAAPLVSPAKQFHLIVPVREQAVERIPETIRSLSRLSCPHWRLTFIAQVTAPQELESSANISWLNATESGLAKEVNRLAAEDNDSDLLLFLGAGDAIEPDALATIAREFNRHPLWQMAFSDQDRLHADGMIAVPFFKPDFSPDLFRSAPFSAAGMLAVRKAAFMELGGLKNESSGAELFDLMLRGYEYAGNDGIGHIQDVLYHEGEPAESTPAVGHSAKKQALQEHFARTGARCDIEDGALPGTFRLRYRHNGEATVTIVIPTLNGGAALQRCVGAVVDNTAYRNWELIIVDCGSNDADTLTFLDFLRDMNNDAVRVVVLHGASIPAALNAGTSLSSQNYLLFLSDSTEPLQADWLDEMLGYAAQPGVGVVGAKALGADGNISFAGYVLGLEGKPAAMHDLHAPQDAPGYFGRLQVPGNPSAVSSACMLTAKALFDELGGFDDHALANNYSDVDYCLKVGQTGKRVVWTPHALLRQEHLTAPPVEDENKTNDDVRAFHLPTPEAQTMFDRWLDRIAFDPSYNRNLSLSAGAFEIETLPALTLDPAFRPVPRILAHTFDRAGSGGNRIVSPLRALTIAGRAQGLDSGNYLSIPDLERLSPDAVIFQRQMDWVQIKMMELYARNSKALRIFELDEVLVEIQQGNQTMAKRFRQALDVCDRLVVPTEYLAEEYRQLKDDIRIAPNCLERARWASLAPKRRQGQKPRVGWAGSAAHETDLALLAEVVRELGNEVEWVFFGCCPEGVRNLVEYHGGAPFDDYPAHLAALNLDLALAPLEDTPLNHGRSHLKLLEYGILGYPVICSDITPYRGAYPVTRVQNNAKSWESAIREQLSDLEALAKRGDVLRDYVQANWLLEDHLDDWLKAWLPS